MAFNVTLYSCGCVCIQTDTCILSSLRFLLIVVGLGMTYPMSKHVALLDTLILLPKHGYVLLVQYLHVMLS